MDNEKEYFDLRLFLITILKKSKLLVIFTIIGFLAGAILSGFLSFQKYNNFMSKKDQYNIDQLKQQKLSIQDSIDFYETYNNRPIMRLNPTSVAITNVSLFISTDYTLDKSQIIQKPDPTLNLLNAYMGLPISAKTIEKINSQLDEQFDAASIRELISFETRSFDSTIPNQSIFNVIVYGEDIEQSSFLAKTFIEGAYELINPTVYEHKLIVIGQSTSFEPSEQLAQTQKNNLDGVTQQTQKLESELGKINNILSLSNPLNIAIKSIKYGIIFALGMFIVGIICILIFDSLNTTLSNDNSYNSRYNKMVFGTISFNKKNSLINRLIYYLENGIPKPFISSKENIDLVCQNILINCGDIGGKTFLLTGSVGQVLLTKTAKELTLNLQENSVPSKYLDNTNNKDQTSLTNGNEVVFIISPSITENSNTLKIINYIDHVILVESIKKSSYIAVDKIIKAFDQINIDPKGFILLD